MSQDKTADYEKQRLRAMVRLENEWKLQARRSSSMIQEIRNLLALGENPYIECIRNIQLCWEFSKSRSGQTLCHQFLQQEPLCLYFRRRNYEWDSDIGSSNKWGICVLATAVSIFEALYFEVILELRQSNDPSVSLDKLTNEVKMNTLGIIIKQSNKSLLDLTCKTYQIDRSCAEIFRPVVTDLIAKRFFVEAASVVNQLGLREEFVESLAIPLMLLEKIPLLEACLEGLPNVQRAVIRGFDYIFEDSNKVQGIIKKFGLKTDKKGDQHLWKMMSKLMTRLLKKYSLPADLCPRLQLSRNRITLRYMLHKKYRDRDVAESSWREMVYDQVSGFRALHSELMRELINYDDVRTAHYFAAKFRWPRHQWPVRLLEYVRSLPPGASSPLDENDAGNNNHKEHDERAGSYLQLNLRSDQINMVQTREAFQTAMELLAQAPLIGIDAEWKPAMGFMQQTRLSLLQMATHDKALLFDVLALKDVVPKDDWENFFQSVFDNAEITILGYGLAEDLLKLERLTTVPIVSRNLVDLHSVQAVLSISRPDLMAPKGPSRTGAQQTQNTGLSRLTQTLLGYPLDKAEQCSDWENRPLRTTQINYAALDAHCLLMCWDELMSRCKPENLMEVVQQAMKEQEQPDQNQVDGYQHSPRKQTMNG
ncbi:putative exonuclease mut-7-like, partial [Tropilaelaps mercedesae]